MQIPDDFWMGTSSSAWQIEGIAGKDKGQESWAELFYQAAPHKWHNNIGPEKASDFYHRYKEDIATMAQFGMNTFRFTIQWARFMKDPFQGIADEKAVVYYQDVIDTIREHGMEPFVSLEHWDLPASIIEKNGGWACRQTVELYRVYVREVLCRLHGVTHYFAFTEPSIPIDNGYMDAIWYPFTQDPVYAYQAHFHKILATSLAVKEAQCYSEIEMGVMIHYTPVYARSNEICDVEAAYYADLFHVRLYMDPYLKGEFPQELISELKKNNCLFVYDTDDLQLIQIYKPDLLGIDYYFPIRVQARNTKYTGKFHPLKYYEP